MQDAPEEFKSNQATVLVLQGLDFFAEVPVLADKMPSARGVTNAVVILVIHDMQRITSTGVKWMEKYVQELQANNNLFILADANPFIMKVLTNSGAMEIIGAENVIPATSRILEAEETAWQAAQTWLQKESIG
ncbi:MAG: hypothetical protein M5U34_13505 [Chloroflexi bacterium]|nr:hypothetical protein [Chloroflexota bacterium]